MSIFDPDRQPLFDVSPSACCVVAFFCLTNKRPLAVCWLPEGRFLSLYQSKIFIYFRLLLGNTRLSGFAKRRYTRLDQASAMPFAKVQNRMGQVTRWTNTPKRERFDSATSIPRPGPQSARACPFGPKSTSSTTRSSARSLREKDPSRCM
jgi:hypothetical protein